MPYDKPHIKTAGSNEFQHELLLRLADNLRSLSDPVAIQQAATHTAITYFKSDRCYYCEVEDGMAIIRMDAAVKGLQSVAGAYPLHTMPVFEAVIKAGRPFIVHDVRTSDIIDENLRQLCIQLQVISFIDVPVIKEGKPVGILCLVQSHPRQWTTQEAQLAREVAERTWMAVDRGKVEEDMHQSLEKYRTLFESIDEGFCIIEMIFDEHNNPVDYLFVEANPAFYKLTGLKDSIGKRMRQLEPAMEQFWFDTYGQVALSSQPIRFEHRAHAFNRWYNVYAFPIGNAPERKVAVLFTDTTLHKESEQQLRNFNEQLEREAAARTQQMRELEQQQQRETVRIILATIEEERRRIADHLHSGLAQMLYGLKNSLSGLAQQLPPKEFDSILRDTQKVLSDAIRENRRISHELMPSVLEDFGLRAAILNTCTELDGNIKFNCTITDAANQLEKYLELAVYRAVQELAINIVKHSGATSATVNVSVKEGQIRIRVADNGKGMQEPAETHPGIGLSSIRSKVKMLQGDVAVKSGPKGTAVSISIPLPAP